MEGGEAVGRTRMISFEDRLDEHGGCMRFLICLLGYGVKK